MCHSEFGPGTEYGCLLIVPGKHRKTLPRGSMIRSMLRTRSLATFMPLALRLPHNIDTPPYGWNCLSCSMVSFRSSSVIMSVPSCTSPYSSRRLYYKEHKKTFGLTPKPPPPPPHTHTHSYTHMHPAKIGTHATI